MGLSRGRTHRCFSQCCQEVPLSTWDLWPLKEIAIAFLQKLLGLAPCFSLRVMLVQWTFCTTAYWLEIWNERDECFCFFSRESQNLRFQGFVFSRAVPVAGSVLCLSGTLSVTPGDAVHPSTHPNVLWREPRVLWARLSAGRELRCISAGLGGHRSTGCSPPVQPWPECPGDTW